MTESSPGNAYTKEALAHVLSSSLEIDFVLETVKNMQRDYGLSLKAETIIHPFLNPVVNPRKTKAFTGFVSYR